jgi:hypothetical protein
MSTGPGNPNPSASNPSIHPAFASIHDELVDHVQSELASHPAMQATPLAMGGPSGGFGLPSGISLDVSALVRVGEDYFVQILGNSVEQFVRTNAPAIKRYLSDAASAFLSRLVTDVEGHPTVMQARQDAAERGGEE